jgi:hypothetical protein
MNKIILITICRVKTIFSWFFQRNKAVDFSIFLAIMLVLIGSVVTSQIEKTTENLETKLCEENDTDPQDKKKSMSILQNYWQLRFWNAFLTLLYFDLVF